MADNLSGIDELDHDILRLMTADWQTMDTAKSDGMFRLSELADHFGLDTGTMRERMTYLEAIGLVEGSHSFGYQPSKAQKGLPDAAGMRDVYHDPVYYIGGAGKRAVMARVADESDETSAP